MAGMPNPAMLAALQGAGPAGGAAPPPGGMPPPPGVPPPGALGAGGNPPGVGPSGPGGGIPSQIMQLLFFLAGAGTGPLIASISKLRSTAGGGHKGGASKDAAAAPGMTIPPQMAQMIAQNPAMATRLMQLVKSQLGGGMPTPGGGV